MKYIHIASYALIAGIAFILFFWISSLNNTIDKNNNTIQTLRTNSTQLESQIQSLESSIQFLEEQKEIFETANSTLQLELEKARSITVPERIRTITVVAKEDPVTAQRIIREDMTSVINDIEESTNIN